MYRLERWNGAELTVKSVYKYFLNLNILVSLVTNHVPKLERKNSFLLKID